MTPWLLAAFTEAALLALASGLGWVLGRDPWAGMRLDPGVAGAALFTLPLLGALWLVLRSPARPWRTLVETVEELVRPILTGASGAALGVLALIAGVAEETLFRGLAQAALAARFGPATGLAVASLLFGLAHPVSRTYVAIASVMGLYLGGLYLASGNLAVPIVVHALYDWAAFLLLKRRLPGVL